MRVVGVDVLMDRVGGFGLLRGVFWCFGGGFVWRFRKVIGLGMEFGWMG